MALWRSWLARRPVTAEVAGSSPVRVAEVSLLASGQIAQSVEHTPEKCGVASSILALATMQAPFSGRGLLWRCRAKWSPGGLAQVMEKSLRVSSSVPNVHWFRSGK